MKRFCSALAALLLAIAAASCTTGGGPILTPPDIPIAFEPITGIPESRAAVLAEELATNAIARELAVVARDSSQARFRIKGYFSAARAGGGTTLTYVWDIVDASGRRVHRLSGAETVNAALPDPWQAITDKSLREVARRTIQDLGDWLDRGAPDTQAAAAAGAASSGAQAASATRLGFGAATALAAGPDDSGPSVFVGVPAGESTHATEALSDAMADQLAASGIRSAGRAEDAAYLVSGEVTLGAVEGDSRTVAVIWSVARPDGSSVGTVRQVARVPADQFDVGWDGAARSAAAAAAPGILSLVGGA